MSGLDDFIKGAGMFQAGMKQLATSSALNNATKQMHELNQQQMDEAERLQASTQVANQLAMQLGAAGADAATIESTAGRMGVGAGAQFNAQEQGKLQQRSQEFSAEEGQKDRDLRRELAMLSQQDKNNQRDVKMGEQQARFLMKYQGNFEKAAGKNLEALEQAKIGRELLQSNNPVADNAIGTFLARATGEVGNLTEAEREVFKGSSALARKARALYRKYKDGRLSEPDRADLLRLTKTFEEANKKAIKNHSKRIGHQAIKGMGAAGFKMTPEEIESALLPDMDQLASPEGTMSLPPVKNDADFVKRYIK